MLLNVHGTANAAFGVVAQVGMAGALPLGVPLNGSQSVWLLKYAVGSPPPETCCNRSGRTVSDIPAPGPMASVGVSGLPVCACWTTPNCHPDTSRLVLNGNS